MSSSPCLERPLRPDSIDDNVPGRTALTTAPDYASFWPVYLAAHRRAGTRALHMLGTGGGLGLVVAAVALAEPWLAVAAPVVGYGFAWLSHTAIEGNRPATFGHPFWSFFSDFRMLFLWCSGRLDGELRRHGIVHPGGQNGKGRPGGRP